MLRRVVGLLAVMALLSPLPAVSGKDMPFWPSPEEERLLEVEGQVLDLQRKLSAARRRGEDEKKVEKLGKEFRTLQKERVKLLRATNKLP